MYLFGAHRSVAQRLRLSLNRDLGAGNFFWHACAVAGNDLDRPVVFRPDPGGLEAFSLRTLRDRVIRYENWYHAHGVGPGTRVGVYTVDGLLGMLHHIAITGLGGVTVLTNPNMDAVGAARYFRHTTTTMVVADATRLIAVGAVLATAEDSWNDALPPTTADIAVIERDAVPPVNPGDRYRHAPADLVLISHSSGTTGIPKPTEFAHHSFSVGKRERLWHFPSAKTDRMVTALPHSHSSGISYLSLAMMLGLPTMMLDDPSGAAVAAAMNTFHPTVVVGFPLSLADLPVDALSQHARETVHTWMGMGDASHERHIRPLVALGRNGSTYVDGLGSSEMGMVLFKHKHSLNSTRYGRIIGKPVSVVSDAVVLDEHGDKLPDGQAGLLGVRTPSTTPGYVDEPGMTAKARSGGYFLTGDVVRRDADGTWYHLDRTPDVIHTVDGPVYSLELEEVVLTETGAFDAAVIAVRDPALAVGSLPVAVVLFKGDTATPEDVLARCNAALRRDNMATLAAVVVAADRSGLPVGVTGKVLKRVLRERHEHLLSEPARLGTAATDWGSGEGSEMTQHNPARAVVDIVTGTWRTQALYAAVALRLPDHIAQGHTTSAELASKAHADPDGIIRLMRLLIALDVFDGDDHTGYALTPMSELLRTGVPGSMRDMCLMYGEEFHRAWGSAVTAVRTGRAGFEEAFDRTLHQYLADEPGAGPKFLRAMNAGSVFFADVPKAYDFTGCHTVTDLAGGSGMLLSTVLRAHPDLHGVLLDREHMLPVAKEYLASTVDPGRYEVVAGDLFDSTPPGSDVYLLSRILQDWDDSECITLLTNVRRAMTSDEARLLIIERVIAEDGSTVLPLLFDLHLLMMAGGRERTLGGYKSVLDGAGLRVESVHELALETSLLVAAPA